MLSYLDTAFCCLPDLERSVLLQLAAYYTLTAGLDVPDMYYQAAWLIAGFEREYRQHIFETLYYLERIEVLDEQSNTEMVFWRYTSTSFWGNVSLLLNSGIGFCPDGCTRRRYDQ